MNKIIKICIENSCEPWLGLADWETVGAKLNISKCAARGRYRRFIANLVGKEVTICEYLETLKNDLDPVVGETPGLDSTIGDTLLPAEETTAFERFVAGTGIDQGLFYVKRGKVWGSTVSPSFSAAFAPRQLHTQKQVDELLDRLLKHPPGNTIIPINPTINAGLSAVFSIYDLHMDQLNFDGSGIDRAIRGYQTVIAQLLQHVANYELAEIVLVVGNDMGNTDNPQNTTTKGTQQENSTTWRLGTDRQCELLVHAVEAIKNSAAKIKIIVVPGNHDLYKSYMLGKFLEGWYRNNPNITIDNTHNTRKYHRFGDVALMFTHGSEEAKGTLPLLFSTEGNHVFAGAKWREILTGHLHGTKETFIMIDEQNGIIHRILPSLVRHDEWHMLKGFVGNKRMGHVDLYTTSEWCARFGAIYD